MAATAQDSEQSPKGGLDYKWKVLISVIFGIFMVILDTTVVNVAFRTVQQDLGATINEAQWILSIYVLMLGISTPISGYMADRFGLKRTYVIGLSIFVLGSFLCGVAPTIETLVIARAIQGLGGGLSTPLGTAFIYGAFPPNERGKALGVFGIAMVLGPALGPILGGLLVDNDLWRWIFFINVPIGVLGVSLAIRWLKPTPPTGKPKLDVLGLITSTVGFGSVLYAATIAAEQGWDSGNVTMWFIIGGISLLLFGLIELFVAKEPLLDLRLFKKPTFAMANLVGWVSVLALFGAEFLLPLYLQVLRGRTALETGFILLPLAVAAGFATPTAGRLYDKIGPRPLIITGYAILILNTWQLSQLQADTSIGWIMFLLALRGLALGMTVQTTFVTALSDVDLPKVPRGSALINATRQVIQSIGVAVLATILASTTSVATKQFQEESQARAAENAQAGIHTPAFGLCETPGVDPANNLPAGVAQAPAEVQNQVRSSIQTACSEQVAGFEKTYHFTFYVAMLALFLGLFLPGWPGKWSGRGGNGAGAAAASH